MKMRAVVSAILALSLSMSGVAFAQRDEPVQNSDQQNRQKNQARQQNKNRPQNQARQQNQPQNRGQVNNNARQDERGAGPDHQYRRGDRLPTQYRGRQYVVDDWRGHNLSAPPRGYHWVQSGSDYVLVAIATGVIMQLLLNN